MASNPVISTKTVSANSFVGSIGINTSAGYYMDGFKNSSLTISSLKYLGINTVRDSVTSYGEAKPVLDAMAAAGIKFDFMAPSYLVDAGAASLASYVDALKAFQAAHPGSIISVEGLNEANSANSIYDRAFTMQEAAAFQKALYTAVKGASGLNGVSVLNLTISHDDLKSYKDLGDLGQYSDYANAHAYPHTGTIMDRSIQYSIDLARGASKNDPIVVTETGYTTHKTMRGLGASETAQAKLILNNLLNAYENGSEKTYIYTLFDTPSGVYRGENEVYFGLFDKDGTPKLAANVVHNFTTILTSGDNGSVAGGATINYSLGNAPAETHSMVMQKSGGVYDLVVWTDKIVWNDITGKDLVTAPVDVTVTLDKVEALVYVYDPMKGTEPIAVYKNVQSFKIPLSDHALIIEVGAKGPVTDTTPVVAPNLTMTTEAFVTQIDTLAASTGLQSITLSDGNVLEVSSIETMKYMIAEYGSVLSKVKGTFTFSVSFGHAKWQKIQTFDENGKLLTRTDYGLSNGKIVSEAKIAPDGSFEYTKFGITGKTYTTEKQTVDASGKVLEILRTHADGTRDYREISNANGSKDYLYYNAKGALLNDVTVNADGTRVTLTYDPVTAQLTRNITIDKVGNVLTTIYKAGVKVSVDTAFKSGAKETVTFDTTTGKILTDLIKNVDGSSSTKVFVNGVLSRQYDKELDGTQKTYAYGLTGRSYTTEIQTADATGKVIDLVRKHADGTLDYRELTNPDGSKEYLYYNARGALLNDVTVNADGTRVTLTYDPVTTKLIRTITVDKDGNVMTATYSAGLKAAVDTVFKSGVTETTTFDTATGKTLTDIVKNIDGSTSTKVFVNGVLSRQYEKNADGTQVNYAYGLTGKTYTTETQSLDARGKVIEVVRKHADGTLDYYEASKTDGSKHYAYYDAKGALTTDVTVKGNGDRVTLTYDPATSKLTQRLSENADGTLASKKFVNGILTNQTVKNADGSTDYTSFNKVGLSYTTERQTVDKAGNVLLIERLHADGTYDYKEVRHTDGSKELSSYDAAGQITTHVTINADKSRTVDTYLKNGTGDIRTDVYDSAIKLLVSDLLHKDGTHAISVYADNQTFHGGAGNDTIQFRSTVGGDFVYDGGKDVLSSFNLTSGFQDKIVLDDHWAASVSDLHLSQAGRDTVISFDNGNSITLEGISAASLTSSHFLFV